MSSPACEMSIPARSWMSYLELTKPRLSSLVLFTALVGFIAGTSGPIDIAVLLHLLVGTTLVAGGANALNQVVERDFDARMERTKSRPLPSGRLTPVEALRFAAVISIVGLAELLVGVNLIAACFGALALGLYVFVYTPLKRITIHNTLVGAVVGAIPPMMGWVAARGEVGVGGWLLVAILFVWQLPHFFSIAWIYRDDYQSGGFRMLSVADGTGLMTRIQIGFLAMLLIPVSLMPSVWGLTGRFYFNAAFIIGIAYLGFCLWRRPSVDYANNGLSAARRAFLASVVYLPTLLTLYIVDKL
ncbi:MAG: protoheme IX farnesyltransferase [Phycisphaerae bacterium]|nr:MAG: protoheme IX farnesyltransferase [Phycisphaerae bacterium]